MIERPHLDPQQVDLEGDAMRAQLSLVARYLATGLGRAEAEAAVESLKQAIAQRPQYHIPRMEIACGLASNADSSA